MKQRGGYEFDNRDSAEVYQYMEARIEALKRRIQELEAGKMHSHARCPHDTKNSGSHRHVDAVHRSVWNRMVAP
jgi:hypothetical protein